MLFMWSISCVCCMTIWVVLCNLLVCMLLEVTSTRFPCFYKVTSVIDRIYETLFSINAFQLLYNIDNRDRNSSESVRKMEPSLKSRTNSAFCRIWVTSSAPQISQPWKCCIASVKRDFEPEDFSIYDTSCVYGSTYECKQEPVGELETWQKRWRWNLKLECFLIKFL